MTGFHCPIEDCQKHRDNWTDQHPPFESIESAVRHLRAKADDQHEMDEEEYRSMLEQQESSSEAADADETPGSSTTESTPAEEESTQKQDESSTESSSEQETMPSEEEYQRQHGEGSSEEADKQEESSNGSNPESTEKDQSSSFLPAMSTKTMLGLLALALLAVLLHRYLKDDETEQVATETKSTTEQEESGNDGNSESTDEQGPRCDPLG